RRLRERRAARIPSGPSSFRDWPNAADRAHLLGATLAQRGRQPQSRAPIPADAFPPENAVNSRRRFLIQAPLGLIGAAAACRGNNEPSQSTSSAPPTSATPGAPPAFNTSPGVGPEVSPGTFAEAEKLVQVTMTPAHRDMAAKS